VIAAVAGAAGAPFGDVTYYDFRYPSATHMLMVAEDRAEGYDFTIKLPSTYGYFDRSWGLRNLGYGSYFQVNGVSQTPIRWEDYGYGTLTASQLLPDITHTISVDDYGILVVIYRIP
jgi:hypothetical protein